MAHGQPLINLSNLRQASRDRVIDALAGFSGTPVATWLPRGHPASGGQFLRTNGKVLNDYPTFQSRFSGKQAGEVLAATSPNHCMDGWTFLSRALAALLAGDTHTARHLAYYAQLRAGLSILGCHGIGIFNTINFVIDASLTVHRIDAIGPRRRGLGTHVAVWEILKSWASDPQSAQTFLQSVDFRGVPLSDCIDAIWPSSGSAPLVAQVIKTWGVDLMGAAVEQEYRNISSYAAHAFNPAISNLSLRLDLVRDIWLCLEPDGRGGFPSLDRHLLRKFLELMKAQQSRLAFQRSDLWTTNFPKLDPSIQDFMPIDFLERVDEPDELTVFSNASSKNAGDVHAMICRALLLLRTATSIVRTAFVDAGFEPLADNVRPWIEPIGIARGFWPIEQQPEEIADLWQEIREAIDELPDSISSNPTDQCSFIESLSTQAVVLSQTERACMWAVCA